MVVSSRKQANVDKAVAELEGLGCSVAGIPCHVAKVDDRERLVAKVSLGCLTCLQIFDQRVSSRFSVSFLNQHLLMICCSALLILITPSIIFTC